MKKIHRTAWLGLLFLSMVIQPIFASAEHLNTLENVELTVAFPYHEKLQGGDMNWTLMEVEVNNLSEEKLRGKLQLYNQHGFSMRETLVAEQAVQVEADTRGQYTFALPIANLQESVLVRLVTEYGQETFFELKDLRNNFGLTHLTIIGEEGNHFHFLKSMENGYLRYPSARLVSPSELPEAFWLYHESIIAVGHLEQEQFSPAQITALEQWVKTGGVLIVSGGEALLPYAEEFGKLLPLNNLTLANAPNLTSSDEERLLTNLGIEEAPLEYPPILVGQPKGQVSFYPSEQSPLFAGWRLGNGVVILAAYDVSQEPLASWQGNKQMWDFVLEKFGALYSIHKKDVYNSEILRLPTFSEQIPNLTAPSIGMISIIWAIYLLVIGPLLYLVLKKWDKREWSWVIIPCLVILTAVSVYMLGLGRIAHTSSSHVVSAIQIYDQEAARIDSSANFFVLEGKSFAVQVEDTLEAIAVPKRNQSKSMQSYLTQEGEQRSLHYENVPYMSLAQVKTMNYSDKLGLIEHDLRIEDNQLKGTLTNQTSLDLEQIVLQIGKQSYELGDLAQKESKEVNLNLAKYYYTEYIYVDSFEIDKPFYETRMGLNNNMTPSYFAANRPTIDLFALSHSPLGGLHIEDQAIDEHYTHLLRQELSLRVETGQQGVYPYGTLPVYMGPESHLRGEYYYHESILTSGSAVPVSFQVAPLGMQVQRIQIPLNETVFSPFTIKIWNNTQKVWEELVANKLLELTEEEYGKYVNPQGELTLLFENDKKENFQLPYPYVQVEGEWKS